MQANKEIAERVQVRLVEHIEELGSSEKNQRANIIERVDKTDRGRNQNEADHEQRPNLVHIAEQAIQSDGEANEDYVADKIAEDRQSEHGLVRENIVGGRGGVPAHDQFALDEDQAKRRGEHHRQVNGASDASRFNSGMHGFLSVSVFRSFVVERITNN